MTAYRVALLVFVLPVWAVALLGIYRSRWLTGHLPAPATRCPLCHDWHTSRYPE